MKTGVRREVDLVVREKHQDGKETVWIFTDHKDRKFHWKTKSDRNLEIGRGYSMKATVVMEQGSGWGIRSPYFV